MVGGKYGYPKPHLTSSKTNTSVAFILVMALVEVCALLGAPKNEHKGDILVLIIHSKQNKKSIFKFVHHLAHRHTRTDTHTCGGENNLQLYRQRL